MGQNHKGNIAMRRLVLALTAAAIVLPALPFPALAQAPAPAPERVRGQVTAVTTSTLTLKARDGKTETVALSPSWGVTLVTPVAVSTIQPGSFIGTTEVDRPDGTGRSLEVHVFPPGVKMGEGHYDWDLKPNSKMTNGTVGKVTAGHKGQELDITYPTGSKHVVVPKNVPVVQMGPGDRTMIKPGAHVFIIAGKASSGGLITNMVVTGVGGAAPPM
jgi:hypothetical protein